MLGPSSVPEGRCLANDDGISKDLLIRDATVGSDVAMATHVRSRKDQWTDISSRYDEEDQLWIERNDLQILTRLLALVH